MNNRTNEDKQAEASGAGSFRPKLTFYHANARGTGAAVSFELHPAHGDTDGSIWVQFANQLTVGDRRGPNPTFPRFDWENKIVARLGFDDLTQMLQVFRGECESINDGKGLYHVSPAGTTSIRLRHVVEPVAGYPFEVYRTPRGSGEEVHSFIQLTPAEALGLGAAIESLFGYICFGIPQVIERDTSEYRAAAKEVRDVRAA